MLNNHLRNLLNVQNRVIVPELGAFLLKGDNDKSIYFNEFLRFNDGLLVSYVAEKENIEIIDAALQIKAFVEEVNKSLKADHFFVIEGVGTLYLDLNDKIQIKDTNSTIKSGTKTKIEKQSINLINEGKTQLENQTGLVTTQPTVRVKSVKATPLLGDQENFTINKNDKDPKLSRSMSNIKKIIVVTSILVIVLVLAYLVLTNLVGKNNTRKNESYLNKTGLDKITDEVKSDSLGALTSEPKLVNKNQSDSELRELKKRPPIEPGTKRDILSKPEPGKQTSVIDNKHSAKKFFIIAGCFSDELNANRLVKKLQSEGFSSLKFATIKNLHYVCYSSYSDKDSASIELTKLKSQGKIDAWIMTYLPLTGK